MTMTPAQKASFDAEIRRSALEEAKVLEEVHRHVLPEPRTWGPRLSPFGLVSAASRAGALNVLTVDGEIFRSHLAN